MGPFGMGSREDTLEPCEPSTWRYPIASSAILLMTPIGRLSSGGNCDINFNRHDTVGA